MKSIAIVLTVMLLSLFTAKAQYTPDILGDGYEQRTFYLANDFDGEVVSTLVRKTPIEGVKRAVLYVHGYNDYFFQTEMAQRFSDSLWNFYAVDLRNYGRSMVEGQAPFKIYDLEEYYEDINSALAVMRDEGNDEIILMGHSTGGLITSLFCDYYRDNLPVEGLILNSPFLDMNLGWVVEQVAMPIVSLMGRSWKDMVILPQKDDISNYSKSLLKEYYGEWEFDTSLKTSTSNAITAGWLHAIDAGHKKIQKDGVDIECPILLMYSDKSVKGSKWSDEFATGDSVLDVKDIAKYGVMLGDDVTSVEIRDGLHDLVLSRPDVRNEVYTSIFDWLRVISN